jgi:predicted transcriptional regulator
MSHTVVLRLSDEDYAPIEREAAATGRTPAEIIVEQLRGRIAPPSRRDEPDARGEERPAAAGDIVTYEEVQSLFAETARQLAAERGRPAEEILAEMKAKMRPKPRPPLSEAERQAALAELLKHAGAVDSGDPNSGDNDRIDADLAREYGRGLDGDE